MYSVDCLVGVTRMLLYVQCGLSGGCKPYVAVCTVWTVWWL